MACLVLGPRSLQSGRSDYEIDDISVLNVRRFRQKTMVKLATKIMLKVAILVTIKKTKKVIIQVMPTER
jgi:hypothetical protein